MTGRGSRLGHAALAAAVAIGLAWTAPAVEAQTRGELRVALPWTPENLDPTMNLSSIRAKVGVSIFDSLVGRDADNKLVPQLAESWKALDAVTWQLKLRRGVVFHDGEPFNAEAVRFTFERVLDPNQKSPNRANVGEVARVEVVDDYTVNLVLRQPYAPLLNRLIDFPIVPPRYTAEKGNQGLALRPVGTGPFRFVELVKDDHLIVEAFDRHWRGAPKIRRIVYKPIPEPFTRAAARRNNEVDLIDTVPPNLATELERAGSIRVSRVPSTWIIYLGLNAFRKPLSDVRVRQALNYATDVDALVKSVLDGNARRMDGPFTPQMFGFDPSVKGYGPDPAKARRRAATRATRRSRRRSAGSGRRRASSRGCRWRSGAPTSSAIWASSSRTRTCSGSAGPCRTATSSTTWSPRRAAASTTRTRRSTRSSTRGAPPWIRPSDGRSTETSHGRWSRTPPGSSSCSRWTSTPCAPA
jgi:peptide/nickel transport system substrate-binding protein